MEIAKRMKSSLLSIVAVCALGAAPSLSQASIFTLNNIPDGPEMEAGDFAAFNGLFGPLTSVASSFYFQLDEVVNLGSAIVDVELASFNIPDLGFSLYNVDAGDVLLGSGDPDNNLSLGSLAAGKYRLDVFGTSGEGGGAFAGVIGITAVPLPAAAWLLLSGLAGLGVVARRRKLAFQH